MAGFVGEAVVSSFIQKLVDMVTSPELWNFASEQHVHSQLQKWKKILKKILAVLSDAEKKHMAEPLVKIWLDELGDLAYDVEDILDEFAIDIWRRNLTAESPLSGVQLRKFWSLISCCSSFTPAAIKFNSEMWSKIKMITERLQEISAQKDDLHLTEIVSGERSTKTREILLPTTSLVDESGVYGRETDKAAIADLLLRNHPSTDEICVIPVVGMAGIGKTTLAQLAFNDDEVKNHFDLRVWVYVSDDFDVLKITKTILQSVSPNTQDVNDPNLLQMTLRENLSGKKFLVILDDVWNENHDSWDFLCMPMKSGAPGSKLIVTTRNEGVVSVAGTRPAYRLQELSYEDCLSIFTQQALGKSNFDGHPHLKEVGEEIALRRCKGLPLAAKALGGMLRNQVSREAWEHILTSKIWDLPEDRSRVIPALKLSYHHLPSHLKQCFAYCSIFPKGYEFNKDELIQLWMAEGFLQQTKENTRLEDLGSKYFYDLLSRSFFQQSNNNSSRFVMHDLINDLALYVSGEICFNLEGVMVSKPSITFKKVRHTSFNRQEYEMFERFKAFQEMKCLRTFVALPLNAFSRYHFISSKVLKDLMKQFKYLRVLSLSGYYIGGGLPYSIGVLKHLRYLNLSNSSIKMLPNSVGNLYNLQTLILSDCWRLTKLPAVIGDLINLRHFDISGTNQLQEIPSIRKLTNLQTLSKYVVGENNSLRIRELKNLQDLRGKLSISGLHNVVDARDAVGANLEKKHNIEELMMEWGSEFNNSRNEVNEMNVLESLRPPRNLKKLTMAFYGGSTFSGWIRDPSFPSMTQLVLKNSKRCISLPSLGKLSSLKSLHIEGMSEIRIVDVEFYGGVAQPFPSLEFLKFEEMPKWENWFFPDAVQGVELFPHLRELTIRNCSKLVGQLPECLPALVKLDISKCPNLAASFSGFASLGELKIEECNEMVLRSGVVADSGDQIICSGLESAVIECCDWLVSLDDQILPCNLKTLKITNCVNLKSLQNVQSFNCLEELEMVGCQAMNSFPETGLPPMLRRLVLQKCTSLSSLPHNYSSCSLESLEIRSCPSLISFPPGELPTTLKQLMVADCMSLKSLPDGMMLRNSSLSNNAGCLQILRIHDCNSLQSFPRGELPSTLKRLEIRHCSNLESVSEKVSPDNTTLEYLEMWSYPNLKSLPECRHNIKQLNIEDCGGLKGFPKRVLLSAPNLRELRIWRCENLKCLPYHMKNLTSLELLNIGNSPGLESFPEGGLAPNLKLLSIINCKNLQTPISEWGLHTLTSLSTLKIWEIFPGEDSLWDDECLFPASLTNLHINNMESLTSLDFRNIGSLQHLYIGNCRKLHFLRLWGIKLASLEIIGCPIFKETIVGSIACIPKFKIDGKITYSKGGGEGMETESRSTLSLHCPIRDSA